MHKRGIKRVYNVLSLQKKLSVSDNRKNPSHTNAGDQSTCTHKWRPEDECAKAVTKRNGTDKKRREGCPVHYTCAIPGGGDVAPVT